MEMLKEGQAAIFAGKGGVGKTTCAAASFHWYPVR